ncbi:helix-turn-helix domain-containing protein [Streptomyces sp. NPDC056503]|uniref:helix-turn-helix domain-containing protein n=1 Tax=Streptomyces sp. NPDC056503 TaxID=3345842 RepID=UPI0036C897EB
MTTGRIELGPTGRTVAANVKRLRAGRGLTLRALSTALKEHGRALSADALNKIENGAEPSDRGVRRVDVDDLMALAVVLNVSPLTLLLPYDAREQTDVTGAGTVEGVRAWEWALAKRPLSYPADADAEERSRHRALFELGSRAVGLRDRKPRDWGDDG